MPNLILGFVLTATFSLTAVAQPAQQAPDADTIASEATAGAVGQEPSAEAAAAPQGPAASGLPQRAPFPRTMAEFWPVFAVFALALVAILGYALTFGRRISRVSGDLADLIVPEDEEVTTG